MNVRDRMKDEDRLQFFKDLYADAKASSDTLYAELEKWMAQYKGSRDIDPEPGKTEPRPAKVVRNITYEFVEAQITTYIPSPKVQPRMVSEKKIRNAKAIETMLNNIRDRLPFEMLNDIDERYSPIYGGSIWLIEWDNSITTHNTEGDVKASCLPPKRFCGQPNIYNIEDMEYLFIEFETTVEDIYRRFGVEIDENDDVESKEGDDKTCTLIVCFFKNDDDKVCQYIWSGDKEILYMENYYQRKKKICKKCGRPERLCECDNPSFIYEDDEEETLDHNVLLSDGSIIPKMSPVIKNGRVETEEIEQVVKDEYGNDILENVGGSYIPIVDKVDVPKYEETVIPYYEINTFPIVVRKNTSAEESLLGQSDCEYIRDQQQEINKIESRILEKILKSGVFPVVPDKWTGNINDSVYENIFRAGPDQANVFRSIDLQANVTQDVQQAERIYEHAKRILGITDSYRGLADNTAKSGVAKQVQVAQASGRLESKRQMKNFAYSEIDKIIFQYYLAYADEPRPAAYRDAQGNLQNATFNRYDFVERDENGNYYYDDDYMFSCTSNPDVETNREWLWEQNMANFKAGAFGPPESLDSQLIYWQAMEQAHYPHAEQNVERIRMQIQKLAQMQQMQAQIQDLQGQLETHKAYEQYVKDTIRGGQNNG